MPFFQGKAEFGKLYPTVRKWCTEPTKIAEAGDILLSVRAPVGPTNVAVEKCCIGRGLSAIRAKSQVEQRYLLHFFRNIQPWLSQQGTGTTFTAISGGFIRNLEFPLPPLDEQKRIADKLDSLLARVGQCQIHLDRLPHLLKAFRQSVLAAAFSGELTEQNSEYEPASELINRIYSDNLKTWGKRFGPEKKFPEQEQPNSSDLPELPDGWEWATPKQLASAEQYALAIGPFGSNLMVKDYTLEGVPLIFVRNIRSGIFTGPNTYLLPTSWG